jgi:DNA helicase-2/ATP-dependent DNA helicase PcrA
MALKSQAVLFRSSSHSAQLELELARRDIPFVKYGGLRFLEAAHVKDALSVLRWADNPRNRLAGFRAVRLVPGVGPATATRLLDTLGATPDVLSALRAFTAPAAARADWPPLLALLRALRATTSRWPAELETVTRWYAPHLHRLYDDAPVRQGDLVQLVQIASTYPSRERFLTEMALDPPDATSDRSGAALKDDDYLILSTIHSAKGQEWKAVQILNVVDGCIPSDMSTATTAELEEERRLLYVAMTRAKEELSLLLPQRFHVHQQAAHGDRHVYASRSRFIPDALTALFEHRCWPVATPAHDGNHAPRGAAAPVDIAARIRGLWR